MKIPDHLVDVVRDLAEGNLKQVSGDVVIIEATLGKLHKNAKEARVRLYLARELYAHVGCAEKLVA